jgi:hypothetical protein
MSSNQPGAQARLMEARREVPTGPGVAASAFRSEFASILTGRCPVMMRIGFCFGRKPMHVVSVHWRHIFFDRRLLLPTENG